MISGTVSIAMSGLSLFSLVDDPNNKDLPDPNEPKNTFKGNIF